MQRWHLTLGLSAAVLAAAALFPSLPRQTVDSTLSTVIAPPPPAFAGEDGDLTVEMGLDQGAILVGEGGDRYVVIDVRAPRPMGASRRPVQVSVVLDLSGSMSEQGKIEGATRGLEELRNQLRDDDKLGFVVFNDRAELRAPLTPVAHWGRDLVGFMPLRPSGGTNLYAGLAMGIGLLPEGGSAEVQRVVLLSDGQANIGETEPRAFRALAASRVTDGVSVSTIGLGLDFNEDLLATLSDAGGGGYQFVDAPGELGRFFSSELERLGAVAGRQTRVELTMGPGVELLDVYGYEAERSGQGASIYLGDVHGGESRKLVARVRVPAGEAGARPLATATVRYLDPDDGRRCAEQANAALVGVASRREVETSVHSDLAEKALRARSADLLEASSQAWKRGDLTTNQALMKEAEDLLERGAVTYQAPRLSGAARDYATEARNFEAAPASSAAGQLQAKRAKRISRDEAR